MSDDFIHSLLFFSKLRIIEVNSSVVDNQSFQEKVIDVLFSDEPSNDFPIGMEISSKHGVIYLIIKYDYIHIFDTESGTFIYMNRISVNTILVTAPYEPTSGIIAINSIEQVWKTILRNINNKCL